MTKNMVFHESYGELPANLLRLIKKHNVSPSDYAELELKYGAGHFDEMRQAIIQFSKNGSYQSYLMWQAGRGW